MIPRTQVPVANFYDWSEDNADETCGTSMYRKIANNTKQKVSKTNNSKNWCAGGIHLNPGRMFLREKADLTKGEREIIAGIYKNRGNLSHREGRNDLDTARCHKDAWLLGKQVLKADGKHVTNDLSMKIPDHIFSTKADRCSYTTRDISCYMCARCKEGCVNHKSDFQKPETDIPGRIAPPTTPQTSPKTLKRMTKIPPIRNGEGGVLIEAEKTFFDESGSKGKRVYVDVFLPKIPSHLAEDATFVSSVDPHSNRIHEPTGMAEARSLFHRNTESSAGPLTGNLLRVPGPNIKHQTRTYVRDNICSGE